MDWLDVVEDGLEDVLKVKVVLWKSGVDVSEVTLCEIGVDVFEVTLCEIGVDVTEVTFCDTGFVLVEIDITSSLGFEKCDVDVGLHGIGLVVCRVVQRSV